MFYTGVIIAKRVCCLKFSRLHTAALRWWREVQDDAGRRDSARCNPFGHCKWGGWVVATL